MSGLSAGRLERRHILRAVQVLGTLALTALLLRQIDWAALSRLPGQIQWAWMAAAFGVLAVSHLIKVVRWRMFVLRDAPPLHMMLAMYGAGLFSSNFLPTGVGGDGTRVLLLSRSVPASLALFSVLLDRVIGLAALAAPLLLGLLVGLPPGLQLPRRDGGRWLPVVLAAGLPLLALALAWWLLPPLRRLVYSRLARIREQQRSAGWSTARYGRLLGLGTLLSMLGHLLTVVAYYAILAALELPPSFGAGLWLVCSNALALLIPLTINGLGLMESTFVVVLGYYGIAVTPALAVALVTRLLTTAFSLLGGLLSLRWSPSAGERRAVTSAAAGAEIEEAGQSRLGEMRGSGE